MKKITIILMILVLTFSGCKTKEYIEVPVEKVKIEYVHKLDSIYLHDSVYTYITQRGDTVFIDRYKERTKNVYKIDTMHVIDTIPKIVTITKTVEVNTLYTWLKILMSIGGVGVLGLLIFLIRKFKIWKLLF